MAADFFTSSHTKRVITNMDEMVRHIKKKGYKTAVVSNTQSDIVESILNKFDIKKYFDIIVGGERVKHGKPNPEIVHIACKELKIKPGESILVGDTIYDKGAAEAAGCRFIGYKLDKDIEDMIEIKDRV